MKSGHGYKANLGSAMIYALIVVMILSIMLTTILNISDYERRVTRSYRVYSNLYDMAVSGVENTLALFNKELETSTAEIFEMTMTEIAAYDISSLVQYENTAANVYDGDFFFKVSESGFADAFAKTADNIVIKKLYTTNPLSFEFSLNVSGVGLYRINVVSSQDLNNTHNITSTATLDQTGASATVKAVIAISSDDSGREMIIPKFGWRSAPGWAHNTLNPFISYGQVYGAALPYQILWEAQNPLLITSEGGISVMDVGAFYGDEGATPSIIISKADELRLNAFDPSRSEYKGVIYSNGNVFIDGVSITGSIISTGEIIMSSSGALSPDREMLFKPEFENELLRRMVYDFFLATSFHNGGDVNSAAVTGLSGVIIENMSAVDYFIKSLVRVY